MAKLRITPNGIVLESEIVISGEILIRLTNPENAKRIKAALSNFGNVSHRLEESDKIVSIMSRPIDNKLLDLSDAPLYFLKDDDIVKQIKETEKNHNEFIDWAQSLPAPTSTIDFKDDDEEICDKEAVKVVKNVKEILKDNPLACKMTIFVKDGIDELCLRENGIKILLNAFIEKYGKKEESL